MGHAGFRGFDIENDHEVDIGKAFAELYVSGVGREHLHIQTRVRPNYSTESDLGVPIAEQVRLTIHRSLLNLGVKYVDTIVLQTGYDVDNTCRDQHHAQAMQAWTVLENAKRSGLVRQLGISNFFSMSELHRFFTDASVKPAIVEVPIGTVSGLHSEMRAWCAAVGIRLQLVWPEMESSLERFWSTMNTHDHEEENQEDEDETGEDEHDQDEDDDYDEEANSVLSAPGKALPLLAHKYNVAPPLLVLRFLAGLGDVVLIASSNGTHMKEYMSSVRIPLVVQDMQAIDRQLGRYDGQLDLLWFEHPVGEEYIFKIDDLCSQLRCGLESGADQAKFATKLLVRIVVKSWNKDIHIIAQGNH